MKIAITIGFLLMIVGLWGILTRKNLIKIVIGLAIMETGIQIVMIGLGFITGKTAPILNSAKLVSGSASLIVDPVPQALVLTAIVIGVAVNALMLTFVVRMYQKRKSLLVNDYRDMKW